MFTQEDLEPDIDRYVLCECPQCRSYFVSIDAMHVEDKNIDVSLTYPEKTFCTTYCMEVYEIALKKEEEEDFYYSLAT